MRGLVVVSALAFAACSDAGGPAPVVVPQLAIVAGDLQTDAVMRTLPVQLGAKLTNKATGEPLPGRIVNWVVVEGGGAVFAAVTQTASDGVARQSWTLGPHAGGQKLIARWMNPETGESVTLATARAIATPDTAVSFEIIPVTLWVRYDSLQTDTVRIEVQSADAYGNQTSACADLGWRSESPTRVWPLNVVETRNARQYALFRIDFYVGGPAVRLSANPSCGAPDSVMVMYSWN